MVPLFESMTYTHTDVVDGRIEHHYDAYKRPYECPHCGCDDMHPAGYRSPAYRHDTEGHMQVHLVIKKREFRCGECERISVTPMTVATVNRSNTKHFWEQVTKSGLTINECVAKFHISVNTIKKLRSLDGRGRTRRNRRVSKHTKPKPSNAPVFVLPPQLPWAANRAAPVTMRGFAA